MTNWMIGSSICLVVSLGLFVVCVAFRRWTWPALGVGLINLTIAALNGGAPFRGLFDEGYLGYQFGLLTARRGLPVAMIAGAVIVGTVVSACLAVLHRRGQRDRRMLWVAAVDAALCVNLGAALVWSAFTVRDFAIQLGEFLTIPSAVGFVLSLLVLVAPLGASAIWAVRQAGGVFKRQEGSRPAGSPAAAAAP